MKILRFVAYLLYRYYSRTRVSDAYFHTISALSVLVFLHSVQIFLLFTGPLHVIGDESIFDWLICMLLLIPIYTGLYFVLKKPDLKSAEYARWKIKWGYFLLILYAVLSFTLTIQMMVKGCSVRRLSPG
jgi:hypothetical protein